MPSFRFKSIDGQIFEVDVNVAKMFGTIKTALEIMNINETDYHKLLPELNANKKTLGKIIEWAEYHKDDPPQPEGNVGSWNGKNKNEISDWDAKFMEMQTKDLHDLLIATNFLKVEGLFELACTTVMNRMEDKGVGCGKHFGIGSNINKALVLLD